MTSPKQAVDTNRGRFYVWPPDDPAEQFISVTNVLDKAIPKPAIATWARYECADFVVDNLDLIARTLDAEEGRAMARKMVADAPYRKSDVAKDIGSLIHNVCEARILGLPTPEVDVKHQGFIRSLDAFLDEWQPTFEMSEATIFSRRHGYAGTCDFICRFPSEDGLCLGDWKTTKFGKQGHGIYPETALQVNAYAHGEFIGLPNGAEEPMPDIAYCIAVNLRPNGYRVCRIEKSELTFRTFLYALQMAEFTANGASLVSAPLAPPSVQEVAV